MIHARRPGILRDYLSDLFKTCYEIGLFWHSDCSWTTMRTIYLEVREHVKKFYYIALNNGKTCEGIIRSKSIDSARQELMQQGMEEINVAILRSDNVDFLDLGGPIEQSATP